MNGRRQLASRIRGQTPMQEMIHEISLLVTKVGLSGIPFASLALDLGAATIRFTNQEQTTEFLDQVAEELDRIGANRPSLIEELLANAAYQSAVSEALNKMQRPRDEGFVSRSAKACVRLAEANFDSLTLGRVLAVMRVLEPELLMVLDAHQRYWANKLTPHEAAALPTGVGMSAPSNSERLTELMILTVGELHYRYCVDVLAQIGTLVDGDGGAHGDRWIEAYRVSSFGEIVLQLFRDE